MKNTHPVHGDASGVAIYWDFENIHAALLDDDQGPGAYRKSRFRAQDVLVEIDAVMSFCSSLGTVAVNRVYANWQWLGRYRADMLNHAVELVQLFSPGSSAKNGADIRLALDALEDISRYPHVTHIVIVSGDSDFISLAQKCRRAGRVVIGIGVQGSVNNYWIKACNEFKFYKTLLGKTGQESEAVRDQLKDASDIEEARAVLSSAIKSFLASADEGKILSAKLKQMMIRLDPSFDEVNYGFSSFADFLRACDDIVEVHRGENDNEVSLASQKPPSEPVEKDKEPHQAVQDYFELLKRPGIKPIQPELRARILKLAAECFRNAKGGKIGSFQELEAQIKERSNGAISEVDVRKVKSLLIKFKMFKFHPGRSGISLWMSSDGDLLAKTVEVRMARLILNHMDPPADLGKVAWVIYGKRLPEDSEELRMIRHEAEEAGLLGNGHA